MNTKVYLQHDLGPETLKVLHEILHEIRHLRRDVHKMSAELDRLTTEVGETKTVVDSAIMLLNQLSQLIRDNATDPAALTALADDLDAKQKELAEAVAANTPGA